MASEAIAYVAVSLDGYIAGEGGTVDFLDEFGSDEYGFDDFLDSVDAVVMGSTTYEQILGWGWPYRDTPGLVLTSRNLAIADGADITFASAPTGQAIAEYAGAFGGRVWIVGGGKVITEGLHAAAIDTLEMYIMPVALGSGIPLFTGPIKETLTLVNTQSFANGALRVVYDGLNAY